MNTTINELSEIVNKRFPRLANYLKQQTKAKKEEQIHFCLIMTYILHKIYFNSLYSEEDTVKIMKYLKNNYIKEYLDLTEDNITLSSLENIINILNNKYNKEIDIYSIEENNLINLLKNTLDISSLNNLKQSIFKTYNAIKDEYKILYLEK